MTKAIDIYLEIGRKRTFAGAMDWPGWCRSGANTESARQALVEYGPRYARVLRLEKIEFKPPADVSVFSIVEKLEGNATTDFGAPGLAPSADSELVNEEELQRFEAILRACWKAFDSAVKSAQGKELLKGPRGGGRQLDGVIKHVLEADEGYLSSLGWKIHKNDKLDQSEALKFRRKEILEGLAASAHGEIPPRGPRGGLRWTPRYYVRHVAWHVIDHIWEIEDRIN